MKKRILAVLLTAIFLAGLIPADVFAADPVFRDVPADAWYYNDVQNAVSGGLVNGRTAKTFCPDENLTYAETVKLAACMYQKAVSGSVTLANGDPWYRTYTDYAKENGIITQDYDWNAEVSRAEYIEIFAHALPDSMLAAVNEVPDGSIPDVPMTHPQAAEIYMLYRVGILEGSGDTWNGVWTEHLCKPSDNIRRSEVAAILTRMMDPAERKAFAMTSLNVQYIQTDGYHDGTVYPVVTLIGSAEELKAYYEANKDFYDLGHREKVYTNTSVGFADAITKYDAAWFETHRLILVLMEEGNGAVRHEVTGVTVYPDGSEVLVEVIGVIPEEGPDVMAEWHILIEMERDISPHARLTVDVTYRYADGGQEIANTRSDAEKTADFALELLRQSMGIGDGPTGFVGSDLRIHTDGKTLVYEREAAGTGSLTPKTRLDMFSQETEWEGHVWEIFSVEEYPDLSRVVIISGSNSSWTYHAREEKNTLVSLLSVLGALGMTANGAKGETLRKMEAVLGADTDSMNNMYRALKGKYFTDGPRLHMANSVWFIDDPSFTINEDFLRMNEDYYDAGVFRAAFDEGTLGDINDWVKEQTDGMIPKILDRIPEEAVMYLVNALAFEGQWVKPYDENQVSPGTFTREDGTKTTADFMYAREKVYLEGAGATGFVKYYQGLHYAFAALLPKEGTTIEDFVASLDGETLTAILGSAEQKLVDTALPKFETGSEFELSEALSAMGMPMAFDQRKADFTGLGTSTAGNIYINRVLHKTFISVAEQGTKAGAATAVEMAVKSTAIPLETERVILDRPFVYMLIDCDTNVPFFIGALMDPAE